jgi:acyl dehydratase
MAPLIITGVAELASYTGRELGVTGWHDVTQASIDEFARVTGDDQWIHLDEERARATPFGGTIAHGYFTLSLGPALTGEIVAMEGFSHVLNYGLDRVRFPAPMTVGGRVRMRATLASVEPVPGGVQITVEQVFEREGGDKPVCVAESLVRLYAAGIPAAS